MHASRFCLTAHPAEYQLLRTQDQISTYYYLSGVPAAAHRDQDPSPGGNQRTGRPPRREIRGQAAGGPAGPPRPVREPDGEQSPGDRVALRAEDQEPAGGQRQTPNLGCWRSGRAETSQDQNRHVD